jgi:signal transduction histidine kinase
MMVLVTGNSTGNGATIAIDIALCSDAFKAELKGADFHFITFDVRSNMAELIRSEHVDTIIAHAQFPLKHIVKDLSNSQRNKLFILIVPDTDSAKITSDMLNSVDAILPANPSLLLHQLRSMLALHRTNSSLHEKIAALEADIATQKRKSSEIDLLKNAIVRNVSHELRTPLLQVKSAVALIGEDPADKKLVNYAQNAVARLETHVKNITMLGHSLDTNISPIILRDAIEYAKRNLTRIWTRRTDSDRIQVKLEENLPPILADKQGLSTVLQLLMDNALKFGQNGDIEVIAHKTADKVYIAVRDNGIGIAQDELQTIFESFYQVDDTSTRPYGGAGVGLALVKLILENHQVKINVESKLNKGSTFWFEIPFMNFDELQ